MADDKPPPTPRLVPVVGYSWNPEPSDAQWEPLTDWLPVSEFLELDLPALVSRIQVGQSQSPTPAAGPSDPED